MNLSQLKKILQDKRLNNKNIISEFNEIKRNEELHTQLANKFIFIDKKNIGQLLYHLRDDLDEQLCFCGKPLRFIKYSKGYFKTCGNDECVSNIRLQSIEKTTRDKYDVSHTSKLKSVKNKIKKTMFSRYGAEHNFTGILRENIYNNNIKHTGYKHPLQDPDILNKRNETIKNKYGTLDLLHIDKTIQTNIDKFDDKNPMKNKNISKKVSKSLKKLFTDRQIDKLKKFDIELIKYDSNNQYYTIFCKKCNTETIVAGTSLNSKIRADYDPCVICNPYIPSYVSKKEIELNEWLISIGEKTQNNVKTFVKNTELDIYLPDRKIGFEFNGLYWHNEIHKDEHYHIEKSEKFMDNGIKIIHIWEDEWDTKQHIIKNRILQLLNKSDVIYARKCKSIKIDYALANTFINNYHLNENIKAKCYYGLFYNNELVSVMSFSKSRYEKDNSWEIIRYCSSCRIIGGASKLLSLFKKEYSPSRIVTYARIDWNIDYESSVYTKIGFDYIGKTVPSMFWIVGNIRRHRMNFQKHKIADKHNSNLTGVEIMHNKGYYRIWDCGNFKFEMICK
jgi:hypothetical protein